MAWRISNQSKVERPILTSLTASVTPSRAPCRLTPASVPRSLCPKPGLSLKNTGRMLNSGMDDVAIHPSGNVYGLVGNDANSLQPKKRPLSSMTPTIILQGDRPELIVGAAGGPRIISATLQTILNVLDFHMPVKEAVEAPRIHHQWI